MKQIILLQMPVTFGDPDFTLRDFFAAYALMTVTSDWSREDTTRYCYSMADDIIKKRKK
jgi:endo-1,4-beta-D-glucanase Y